MLRTLASRIQQNVGVGVESTFLYQLSRHDPHPDVTSSADPRYEILDASSIERIADLGPFDAVECAARLVRGDRCYAAFVGDELAHYSWVQRTGVHPIDAAGQQLPIEPEEFWIYNCRTAEAHRGKGLYPATLSRIVREHFEEGFAVAWIYTAASNLASQHGITRTGFVQVDTLRALRIGRFFKAIDDNRRAS